MSQSPRRLNSRSARRLSRRPVALISAVLATPLLLLAPQDAVGVNITMNYNAASSIEPASDPTGANLSAIMTYLEGYYQDIFEDAHNLSIEFFWDNDGNFDPNVLASHSLLTEGGSPHRELTARIRFNNSVTWFFDSTPSNDSEFTMAQTLWRDLDATQRSNDFNFSGTIPATFEVGYTGTATAGGGATGATDMLSVAMHEVGHALGMSSANDATQAETADNDYDFNPLFVNGATLAAETASTTNEAHLDAQFALMEPSIGQGLRVRASHTDLFAMAAGHEYTDLDVPRREFYGGTNWNLNGDWSGNKVPSTADETHVRNPGVDVTVGLTAAGFAGTLFVAEAAWVETGAFKLDVTNTTTIDGSDASYTGTTRIRAEAGGEFETSDLSVLGGAYLELVGGLADILDDATVDVDSRITGYGTVTVGGTLRNDGQIIATNATTPLTITGGATINLDGTSGLILGAEPGRVTASGGNIVINGTVETFNGVMTISADRTITFNSPWTLGGSGTPPLFINPGDLIFNGGADSTTAATLAGANATLDGNVVANGFAIISAPVDFVTPSVSIPNADDILRLTAITTYNGGTYTGLGMLDQNANFTVTGNTTIAVATFDWDGFSGNTQTTINSGISFTINSANIDSSGALFNGTIQNNGGTLAVNTPWTLDGDATMTLNSTLADASVTGTGEIDVEGTIDANGTVSTISSPIDFQSSAIVTLTAASDELSLTGPIIFRGGSYTGAGTLHLNANATVAASTTINVAELDWDGSIQMDAATTINSGVTLTINSTVVDIGGAAFNDTINVNSGILTVNTAAAWTMDGALNLTNTGGPTPSLNGTSGVTISGALTASGGLTVINTATSFAAPTVSIPGILTMAGVTQYNGGTYTGTGTLRQNAAATVIGNTTVAVGTFDLDGLAEALGSLTVNSGVTLTINSTRIEAPGDGFDGVATLQGGTMAVNTAAQWALEGTLNMNKPGAPVPTLGGTAEVLHTGTINVSNGGNVTAPYRFGVTPTVNVTASTLLMSGNFSSNAGATLSKTGAGTLRVGGVQSHAAGATINVNAGNLLLETNADPTGAAPNLRITTNPTGTATFNAAQRLDSLIINNNSSATLGAAGNRFVYTHTLSITGNGFLELNDNDAIIDYAGATPFVTIRGYVVSGYNAGNWNGVGIRSAAANAQPDDLTALAIAENSLLGFANFDGQIVDNTSILIKYTYYGDSNFNGRIDRDDFALADKGLAMGLTGWVNGDYNYSGSVTLADITLLDKSFLLQFGTLAPDFRDYIATREAQYGAEYAAGLLASVPEPGALAGWCVAASLVSRRRRRG